MPDEASPQRHKQQAAIAAAKGDQEAVRREFYFQTPACLQARLQPLLHDQRDLPILHLFLNVLVTVLPAAVSLFALPAWSKVLGPVYLVTTYDLFLERFLLALHYSQHRKLFAKGDPHTSCAVLSYGFCSILQYSKWLS